MGTSPYLVQQPECASPPSESDKASFLSVPENYREHTHHVAVIQTHHAWVFLTDKFAYKMKKPSRHGRLDYSSLETRQHLCNEEYRLNRRLARRTYLGVLPLVLGHDGQLALGGPGTIVEWLVKMRRLPRERMLHIAAANGIVGEDDISRLMRKMLRFYNSAPVCDWDESSYSAHLHGKLIDMEQDLAKPECRFPTELVNEVVDRQRRYITTHAEFLETRLRDGRVRECHGDLRPEHVCLMPDGEPEIIDCLEFDLNLRCLDCIEELAYLGLECRVIGQIWLEERCIHWYQANSDDPAPMHLWHFYAARRATVRAMLSAWHILDGTAANEWSRRGRNYLGLALEYLNTAAID